MGQAFLSHYISNESYMHREFELKMKYTKGFSHFGQSKYVFSQWHNFN